MADSSPSNLDLTITLISFTTVSGVLYTFSFILYCLCVRLSYFRLREKIDRQTILTFILASIMVICATMSVVLNNQYGRIIFVDYNTLSGGPLGLPAQNHAWIVQQVINVGTLVASVLGMGILLQRVWIVYSGISRCFSIPIVILASLLYVAFVVSSVVQTAYGWAPLATTLPKITRTFDIVTVVNYWWGVASTVVMTLMITTRLMLIRHKHIQLMGETDIAAQYLGIVAMLVESYALNTAWNISYIIAYILRNGPAHNFFTLSRSQIEAISYFLLLYRVLSGRVWDRQTRNRLTTLRWQHSTQPSDDDSGMESVNIHANCTEANLSTFDSRKPHV